MPHHDPDEFKDVQDIARAVRAKWRLPSGPVPDVISLLEDAGAIVVRFPFTTPHVDAISWWVPGAPPLIFVNREMPPDKERWSCAHELGHLVMHRDARPEMEKEANIFASEFLTPAAEIKPELEGLSSLSRLLTMKPFWRVSMAALLYRAHQLGCINDSRYRYLMVKMAPTEGASPRRPTSRRTSPVRCNNSSSITRWNWATRSTRSLRSSPLIQTISGTGTARRSVVSDSASFDEAHVRSKSTQTASVGSLK